MAAHHRLLGWSPKQIAAMRLAAIPLDDPPCCRKDGLSEAQMCLMKSKPKELEDKENETVEHVRRRREKGRSYYDINTLERLPIPFLRLQPSRQKIYLPRLKEIVKA